MKFSGTRIVFATLVVSLMSLAAGSATPQDSPQQKKGKFGQGASSIPKAQITPHWFADDTRFWYRNTLKGGAKEFVVVDAEAGKREPAFDHAKLATALSKAASAEYKADRLPFDEIEFADGGKELRFDAAGKAWKCDLGTYECTAVGEARKRPPAKEPEPADDERGVPSAPSRSTSAPEESVWSGPPAGSSITGRQVGRVHQGPQRFRPPDRRRRSVAAQQDRRGGRTPLACSPGRADSKIVVGFRIEPGENKEVHLVESSPSGGGRAKLTSRPYPLPGDKFTAYEPWVFDVASKTATKVETDRIDFGRPRLRWKKDGRHFTYEKVDRGHQRFRLVEVDAHTGKTRNLIDEKTETFIWTAHAENVNLPPVTWLEKTDELIYASEKDGWRHLYLVDAKDGTLKNQITKGECVVRGIDRIDEDEAADLVPRQRQERGPGPVLHPPLPGQLRWHRPGRPDRRQRHAHRPVLAGPQVPRRHLLARGPAAGPRAAARVPTASWSASWKRRTSPT